MTPDVTPEVFPAASDGSERQSHSSGSRSDTSKTPSTVDTGPELDKLEPIAVVGLSLRFPQDATTVENFWKLLIEKRCTVTPFPEDRLSVSGNYHPDPNRRDTVSWVPIASLVVDTISSRS